MLSYTVVSGDTLGDIAADFGVSLGQMLAANPSITNPDLIYVGQVVMIPPDTAPSTSTAVAVIPQSATAAAPSSGTGITSGITSLLQDKTKLITILAVLAAGYYFFTMKPPKKQLSVN